MEERPSLFSDQPALSDTMADDEVAYRPVSSLAVLGAALALASPLALVSRYFTVLPLIAAVISFAGARGVQSDPAARTGGGLARFGLALSLAVLGATLVRTPMLQSLHEADSALVVEAFLSAMADGDLVTAYELTRPYDERLPTPELAARYYEADDKAQQQLADFGVRLEIARLARTDASTIQLIELSKTRRAHGRYTLTWLYRAPSTEKELEEGLSIQLDRPATNRRGPAGWRVSKAEFVRLLK